MYALSLLFVVACTPPDDVPSSETPDDPDPTEGPSLGDGTLFDRTRIGTIDLQLTDAAAMELGTADPTATTYVESRVQITTSGEPIVLDGVGLQVKGSTTWTPWPDKSSLKVKFDAFVDGQDVDGFERVALHNLVFDRSFLRESMAWWAFAELGVPAPRAAHVAVLDRGAAHWEPNNLYVLLEAVNGDFLEERFDDPSGPMWEGPGDLGQPDTLECDAGDCTDTAALLALDAAIETASDDEFVGAVSAWLDWDAFLRLWTVEAMVQQGDGFTGSPNNWRIYWEPTKERFYVIPWSLDLTFATPGAISPTGSNAIVTRCLAIDACRDDFHDELLAVADAWEAADAVGELDRMQDLLVQEGFSDDLSAAEYDIVRKIVADRPATARAWVAANE